MMLSAIIALMAIGNILAISTIVGYIIYYTIAFAWYKNSLAVVMNITLMAMAVWMLGALMWANSLAVGGIIMFLSSLFLTGSLIIRIFYVRRTAEMVKQNNRKRKGLKERLGANKSQVVHKLDRNLDSDK